MTGSMAKARILNITNIGIPEVTNKFPKKAVKLNILLGIYFSSSCLYTIPYFATKPKPAILVCLVTPGNIRPIIENYKGKVSFLGVQIEAGYQAHYVLTNRDGAPCTNSNNKKKVYDELVISAEGQIVPIFLCTIDRSNLMDVVKKFQRQIVASRDGAPKKSELTIDPDPETRIFDV